MKDELNDRIKQIVTLDIQVDKEDMVDFKIVLEVEV